MSASKIVARDNSEKQANENCKIEEATVQHMLQTKAKRNEQDGKKEKRIKTRRKREKGRKGKGATEKVNIEKSQQALKEELQIEKEMEKRFLESRHRTRVGGRQESERGKIANLRIIATGPTKEYTRKSPAITVGSAVGSAVNSAISSAEPTATSITTSIAKLNVGSAASLTSSSRQESEIGKIANLRIIAAGSAEECTRKSPAIAVGSAEPTATSTTTSIAKLNVGSAASLTSSKFNSIALSGAAEVLPTNKSSTTPKKGTIETSNCNEKPTAIRDTARLYSELPIYYPSGVKGAAHETEIRLIELKPASMREVIHCDMYCTTLQKNPKFIALSYFWGKDGMAEKIIVKDYEIPVTKNLHQALIQLRKSEESVFLWADAICINQTNVGEKEYQVTQMPKIYSAAQEVVAWLGERTDQSDAAMELLTLNPADLKKKDRFKVKRDLEDLFKRDYWTRVWMVQELAAHNRTRRACTLRCGNKSTTLGQFRSFMQMILRMNFPDLKGITRPKYLLSLGAQDDCRTFLDVLWEASRLDASCPLDRIYGIRGISPKFYRNNIKVDYKIDFERLCTNVMSLIINKERSLDVLCYFHRYTETPSPSWLRDFRERNSGIPPKLYSCDKGRKAKAKIVNGILRTRGVCIGRVEKIEVFNKSTRVDTWPWVHGTDLKLKSQLRAIEILADKTLERYYEHGSEESRENRFLEMFAGGKQQLNSHLGRDYHKHWRYIWRKRTAFEEGTVSSYEWSLSDGSFCKVFGRLINRCVFTSVEGNLGLGPLDTQQDDLVCILYGCRLPVILRQADRFYTFIGPAYVDSAMNGEFVRESDKEDRFWIR